MKRVTLEIETLLLGRKKEVTGYEVVPGLAVVKKNGTWTVVHISSGLVAHIATSIFFTRKDAVLYTEKLVRVFSSVDWVGMTVEQITASIRKEVKERFKVLPEGGLGATVKQILGGNNA